MKNALRVWLRDIKRLLKSPQAITVVLFLVTLPSLYTWFNVWGFWDPYGNTGSMRVCVVNEDKGADSDMAGHLDLGSQVVDSLHENTQLGWEFVDYETAMDEVDSGRAYAAFVLPKDFSADFASVVDGGDFTQPQLRYYVNEKAGAVSPKITDAGSTQLDETINSTFVSTVSQTVTDVLNEKVDEARDDASNSRSAISDELAQGATALQSARNTVQELDGKLDDAQAKVADAQTKLKRSQGTVQLLGQSLDTTADLADAVSNDATAFTAKVSPALSQGTLYVSTASSKTNQAVSGVATVVDGANDSAQKSISSAQDTVSQVRGTVDELNGLMDQLPDGDAKASLQENLDRINTRLDNLAGQDGKGGTLGAVSTALNSANDSAQSISQATGAVDSATQGTIDAANDFANGVSSDTLPAINSGVSQLTGTARDASSTVKSLALLIDQTNLVLDQLDGTIGSARSALSQTDDLLGNVQQSYSTVQTDVAALTTSQEYQDLMESGHFDAQKIADFMSAPTQLKTESLYPVNSYGAAMAPLFINLTLWIGVIMLMVILRQDMDDEGIENLTIRERYAGRFLFLAPLVALQASICVAGTLYLGVQPASAPLLFVTAIMCSLAYLAIQYTLSVTLSHIGKGLCIVLVFVQIPGATGLYPIEMTPQFFRNLYPLFPFTYGINAMRETIAGFYDGAWAGMVGVLVLFFLIFFVIGLVATPFVTNLNRMFAHQIRESDICTGGDVIIPARHYRMQQLINDMDNRGEFREQMNLSANKFFYHYPRLKRGVWIVGILLPIVLTAVLAALGLSRVVVLTMWLVWFIFVLLFLVVVEKIKDDIEHRVALEGLSDEELRNLYHTRNTFDSKDYRNKRRARRQRMRERWGERKDTIKARVAERKGEPVFQPLPALLNDDESFNGEGPAQDAAEGSAATNADGQAEEPAEGLPVADAQPALPDEAQPAPFGTEAGAPATDADSGKHAAKKDDDARGRSKHGRKGAKR